MYSNFVRADRLVIYLIELSGLIDPNVLNGLADIRVISKSFECELKLLIFKFRMITGIYLLNKELDITVNRLGVYELERFLIRAVRIRDIKNSLTVLDRSVVCNSDIKCYRVIRNTLNSLNITL